VSFFQQANELFADYDGYNWYLFTQLVPDDSELFDDGELSAEELIASALTKGKANSNDTPSRSAGRANILYY